MGWIILTCATEEKSVREGKAIQDFVRKLVRVSSKTSPLLQTIFPSLFQHRMDQKKKSQHDNDPDDYRSITIVPSIKELRCPTPWLPPNHDGKSSDSNAQAYVLERQFRLLREDMLGPLRDELRPQNINKRKSFAARPVKLFTSSPVSVEFKFNLPPGHPGIGQSKKSQDYWTRSKVLAQGSLVCVMQDNDIFAFGLVVRRDVQAMARGEVGLDFPRDSDYLKVLALNFEQQELKFQLVSVGASFSAYEPVLNRLQRMASIPFAGELLASIPKELQSYSHISKYSTHRHLLDEEQKKAFDYARRQTVSLVQGPPGTGKTFLGVRLARQLLDEKEKILCVCYTNHALDQFLNDLIEEGVSEDRIVRIGGRSKSARLVCCILNVM